ncbi:MAG: hypothetical protein H8D23_18325 [Candidatus Brocadiales bacterium]|nr:hypothetical protein [Candidatus Brocadiales bacterium]
MADKIKFAVSCQPIEDVGASQQGSASNFIAASEGYGSGGGSGEVLSVAIVGTGGSNDGYLDGARFYMQAVAVAESGVTPGTHGIVSLASCNFLYIKHTGFQYSSTSALSSTVNQTDVLSVMVNAGAGTDICIARLEFGEAIVLPCRTGLDTNNIMLASTDGGNLDGTIGVNDIAVEFYAFA